MSRTESSPLRIWTCPVCERSVDAPTRPKCGTCEALRGLPVLMDEDDVETWKAKNR